MLLLIIPIIFAVAPVLNSITGGALEIEPLDTNLTLYLDFEEMVNNTHTADKTSNNNDGRIFGANRTFSGKVGHGMIFDGVDNYIVGNSSLLDFNTSEPFTITALIYRNAIGGTDPIYSKRGRDGYSYRGVEFEVTSSDKLRYELISAIAPD